MKTKTTIIVILTILFATNVFASKTPKIKVTPLEGTKVLITVHQEPRTKQTLTIASNSGEIIYSKRCKRKMKFTKQVFNFSNLENGDFEVKLKVGETTYKNELNITDGVILVKEQLKEMAPYFSIEDNVVKITYLNFEKEPIYAHLYQGNKLIHESKYGNEFTLNKSLNLSKLEKGNYALLLESGNKEYWYSFAR